MKKLLLGFFFSAAVFAATYSVTYDSTTGVIQLPASIEGMTFNGDLFTDFTGTGLQVSAGSLQVDGALAALFANPNLYQSTNTTLTRLGGIGAGTVGDIIWRDPVGWTNYAAATSINGGFPNSAGAVVHWSQLVGVPADFADGNDAFGAPGAGDDVWFNHNPINNPNFTNAAAAEITWTSDGGTNLWPVLDASVTRDTELSGFLTQASASALYQGTNANLTLLQAYGPTTWQATNAALTALAGNPQLYQATNAALTALVANPQMYQATNANLTLLSAYGPTTWQATNANLTTLAGNDGSYITNAVPGGATNLTQFVTLEQLQNSVSLDTVRYLTTLATANGFTLTGTIAVTNWSSVTLPAQNTNAVVTTANGNYLAAFISTNTFKSLASGLIHTEIWCYDNVAGSGEITTEFYIVNAVTMAEEYEFSPPPAYQTVPAGSTPTKLTFSTPAIDYSSTTNLHLMVKIKVQESSTPDPTIRIVTGGIYPSHVAFTLPSQNFVAITGDTMTGLLAADGGLSVGVTNIITELANKANTAGAGDDVWVNHGNVVNPNLTNAAAAEITWTVSGTNVVPVLAAAITRDTEISGLLNEAAASALYQGTNANLTALASNPQLYQATNAALTALAANPQLYQATNAALTALAGNPNLYQATNTVLTTWSGITPGANVGTFLATPSSANLRGAVTDEEGTGVLLFAGGNIGAATATTAAENDNDTSVATTAYVQTELSSISGTGDSGYVNGTAVSDEFALTNTVASATVAATTWSLSALASPDPDRVSVAIGAASATEAGLVTANAQTLGGAKTIDLGASSTATTPGASDNDTSVATSAFVTGSTVAFTGKTLDAAGTGNVLKQTKYLIIQRPDYTDGAGAVLQTNALSASGLMHATFSGNAETNANWAVYEFTCPPDLDVAVAMTATFSFLSGGTDADDYVFHLTYGQVASGTAYPTGTGIASLPIVMTINTVTEANGDIQTSAATTLTGWAAALTPGLPMAIRVARLQNAADDGARDVCLVIAYGSTL